jgi:hypothetical protein
LSAISQNQPGIIEIKGLKTSHFDISVTRKQVGNTQSKRAISIAGMGLGAAVGANEDQQLR